MESKWTIRRSERKPKAEIIKAELETIGSCLSVTDDSKHGIEVAPIENKGRGIKAVKSFDKGRGGTRPSF